VAKIGLLGGTFNPPHLGHLALAVHALDELDLDRVFLVPARCTPNKRHNATGAGPEQRAAMVRLLADGSEHVGVCTAELDRRGPSFTVDTLAAIHASKPDDELTFILGADTACTLASWREPRELLSLCALAVAAREGFERDAVEREVAAIDADAARALRFLDLGELDVSSSRVRELVAAGQPVDELTGAGVARYISEHGLYRDGGE